MNGVHSFGSVDRSGYGLDTRLQPIQRNWLLNIIIHPELLALVDNAGVFRAGNHDETCALGFWVLPHALEQLQAIHIGHVIVGNHEMIGGVVEDTHGFHAVSCRIIVLYPHLLQRIGDQSAAGCCVVDNQNSKFLF